MTQEKASGADFQPSYKETLNLLKTGFSMRANASQREPEIQAFWTQAGIDLQLGLEQKGPTFTLHDGPPYANGSLHMGHALNKILKDIINKYKILCGSKVCFVPGWDCHGLPIELKVLQGIDQEQRKNLTPIKLRKKAAAYARKQVAAQMVGFQRWGVWGDWNNSYLTLQKEYESAQIQLFGTMALNGHIYRGLKPVHWSPSSRTALAEAELEYPEGHQSPSAYIAFSVTNLPSKLREALLSQGINLPSEPVDLERIVRVAIWTTTPWTIPANLAVSVNRSLEYAFVEDGNGCYLIIASDLKDEIAAKLSLPLRLMAIVKGDLLEGIFYKHPLFERISPVISGGDYITTDAGTGLVHTAPGHGVDDFHTGKKHGLEVLCPVDEAGNFTDEAGPFQGLNVLKTANREILEALKNKGSLLKHEPYTHKYPYDWRTKKPTIFRATEQWFASVEGFRKQALHAIESVEWFPLSGRNRIESMVKERGDWCISRQRTWGVPIPVFYKRSGDGFLMNAETITYIRDLIAKEGADIWWQLDEVDLLPPSYRSQAELWRKGTDTMDVWFDSGSSWASVLKSKDNLGFPADLYLEGSDQHRGWFQSSLLTSVAVEDKAPYKKVLTHGFALDETGRKMSKSMGNVVDPSVIINGGHNQKQQPPYGADVLRLWVSSVDYSVDVQIGDNILRQVSDIYRKVRNTSRYLLGNLNDFDPQKDAIPIHELPLIDKWMLQRNAEIIDQITTAYEEYEFSKFFQLLQSYCIVDLSSFYLDIAKDRLYVSSPSSARRRSCQTVLSILVETIAVLISPVLCHTAEDIWQNLPYPVEDQSVFKRGWPVVPDIWRDVTINAPVLHLRHLRSMVNRVLEDCRSKQEVGSSLEASVRIDPKDEKLLAAIEWLHSQGNFEVDALRDWLLVSNLQIGGEPWAELIASSSNEFVDIEIAHARGTKCARCWHYETDIGINDSYPDLCGRCSDVLLQKISK